MPCNKEGVGQGVYSIDTHVGDSEGSFVNQEFRSSEMVGGMVVGGEDTMAEDRVKHLLTSTTK